MALSISQKINIGNASSIFASNELGNGKLHGGVLDEKLPTLIYLVRQGLEWLYELDPTHEDLVPIGNYLIAICRHSARAELAIVGGGVTPTINRVSPPLRKDFIVSASSYIVTGGSTKIITEFIGYNLDFHRNGIPQSTVSTESSYFTWDEDSGIFICSPSLSAGELIALIPV